MLLFNTLRIRRRVKLSKHSCGRAGLMPNSGGAGLMAERGKKTAEEPLKCFRILFVCLRPHNERL